MTSMLRKHDSRMDNLQTASTVVDASARIYSFRVDAVHYDVLKMAGGLSKAAQVRFFFYFNEAFNEDNTRFFFSHSQSVARKMTTAALRTRGPQTGTRRLLPKRRRSAPRVPSLRTLMCSMGILKPTTVLVSWL